jgi:hypothetical protein
MGNTLMRNILVACLALGSVSVGFTSSASAADAYWQTHHEAAWEGRESFKEPEHQKPEWLGEHCVRTWAGKELCRR